MTNWRNLLTLTLFIVLVGCSNNSSSTADRTKGKFDFAALDRDGDGKVSKQEFLNSRSNNRSPERLFDRLDSNNDGYLTQSEVNAISQRGRRR